MSEDLDQYEEDPVPAPAWAAWQLRLPARWYQDMPLHDIGFPISGDATALRKEPRK